MLSPPMAAEAFASFKAGFPRVHVFWSDETYLTDTHQGRLATLDGSVPWRAVRSAVADLVERIDSVNQPNRKFR